MRKSQSHKTIAYTGLEIFYRKGEKDMNRKWFFLLIILIALYLPGLALAAEQPIGKGKEIRIEGTVQGLLSTCAGKVCKPGEEYIVTAIEDDYVLVTDSGKYYMLLNLKSSQLSRFIGKMVRVKGVQVLGGNAILVNTAEVMKGGKWIEFYSPAIREAVNEFMKLYPELYMF